MYSSQAPFESGPIAELVSAAVAGGAGGAGAPARGSSAGAGSSARARLELHPAVRAAREDHVKTSLLVGDVAKSAPLAQHFQQYTLADYFDHRGQRVFQNLSMSLAAKNYSDIGNSFGSVAVSDDRRAGSGKAKVSKHLSARAYRLATEMVQKDRDAIKKKNDEYFQSLEDDEKVQLHDVQRRQQEMIFLEVPSGQIGLPPGCELKELLPANTSRLQEREERRRFERLNKELLEGGYQSMHTIQLQNWIFGYEGVQQVIRSASVWTMASGLSTTLGVDRATFCQFILDLDLVDQETVPYVWAVSVFDEKARLVKTCAGDPEGCDPHHEGRIPVMPLVCKWDFIVVLDTILRRRFEHVSSDFFLGRLGATTEKLQAEWQRQDEEEGSSGGIPARTRDNSPSSRGRVRKIKTWQNDKTTLFEAQSSSLGFRDPVTVAWLQQPRGGSGLEVAVWKRNRRISGMLVEPEVLQLVEQYRGLFQQLFSHYCSDEGAGGGGGDGAAATAAASDASTMEFASLLQFCHDFSVVPRLASRHEVFRAFMASDSHFAATPLKQASAVTSRRNSAAAVLEEALVSATSTPRNARTPRSAATALMAARRLSTMGTAPFGKAPSDNSAVNAAGGRARGASLLASARRASAGSRPAPGSPPVSPTSPRARQHRGSTAAAGGAAADGAAEEGGGGGAEVEVEAEAEDNAPALRRFGLAVFVETLCRIAFGYLLANGNSVQLATSSRAKMVWLIAYLHGVFLNLQRSHGRRQGSSAGTVRPASSATPDNPFGFCTMAGGDTSDRMPSPPSSAGSSMPRRLALVLERLSPSMFSEPTQPPLQQPLRSASKLEPLPFCSLGSLSRRGGSVLLDKLLAERAEANAAGDPETEPDAVGFCLPPEPRSPSSVSSRSRGMSKAAEADYRRTSKNRRMPAYAMKQKESAAPEARKKEESREHAVPRDAFTFQSLLFHRLLQSTTRSLEGAEGSDDKAQAALASSAVSARNKVPPGAPNNCSRRILASPDAASGTGRRLVCCIQSEREALAKRLHEAVPRLERSCLTPPPTSAFAVQLSARVDRMVAANTTPGAYHS